ncbi:MAG: hypothetical protein QOH38_1192 [Thermoleophilaceae bacterium]|nr:hypothetical protein [Thermoleophilaceae bacterium]
MSVLAVTFTVLPASAGATVTVTTDPGLQPKYSAPVSDYVSRCVPGTPVRVSVSASDGERVAVAGDSPRSGSFDVGVGLRPGRAFSIRVTTEAGTAVHHVRCLPRDFPEWTTDRQATPQAQWYVTTPVGPHPYGYIAIFDARGVPVWWRHSARYGPWDGKLLPDGNLAWTRSLGDPFGVRPMEAYEERTLDGRLVRLIRAVGNPIDTHELTPMPNGHFLAIAYRSRRGVDLRDYGGPRDARVWDGEIQEIDRAGHLVWSWNSKDHIALSETARRWWDALIAVQPHRSPARRGFDLIHANSVEPDGDGVILSARYTDAIYRIDRKTGAIDWKLGGSHRSESLTVLGPDLGQPPLGGQHDARLYGDGTLTVFDNGTRLDRPPRALRFRVDPAIHTATLLERIETPLVTASAFVGSARKLPGGDWVICWGGSTVVTEQRPSGAPVLTLHFIGSYHSYRAVPILPGVLGARALRRGMNRMNARATGGGLALGG